MRILETLSRLHWLHWFILTGSVLITFFAWNFSRTQLHEKQEMRFSRDAAQTVRLLRERMHRYEDALWSGVASMRLQNGTISHSEWREFAQSLRIDQKYPGINGIGVIYNIPVSQREQFIAKQRIDRPKFTIHPQHNENELWPITFIEPESINAAAVGLDMAHEQNRFDAAQTARDTGKAIATGPIILVQDAEKTPGFLFYAPIYKRNSVTNSVSDRRKAFAGLVYAPFVVKKLMQGTLKQEHRLASLKISDGSTILYDELNPENTDFDPNPIFTKSAKLDFYGRNWDFFLTSTKAFRESTESSQPTLILLLGMLVDSLLLLFFLILSRSNRQAIANASALEKRIIERESAANQAAKLASLGEMAAGIAHEINNPLAIIGGTAVKTRILLKRKGPIDPDVAEMFNCIEKTVARISAIIKGMRNLSRDTSQDPFVEENLEKIFEDTLALCVEKFRTAGIRFSINDYNKSLAVSCRRIELSQVLVNLMNNSVDAIRGQKDPWIKVNATECEGNLRIELSDSGKGIAPEIREQIFTPFFTTKAIGKGTGLGLSIAARIIRSHGGKFYYCDQAENTTFIIEIPLGIKHAEQAA